MTKLQNTCANIQVNFQEKIVNQTLMNMNLITAWIMEPILTVLLNTPVNVDPAFMESTAKKDIGHCKIYTTCQKQNTWIDEFANYICHCIPMFGVNNCLVPLIGCEQVTCSNGRTWIPDLIGEEDMRETVFMQGLIEKLCQILTFHFLRIYLFLSLLPKMWHKGKKLTLKVMLAKFFKGIIQDVYLSNGNTVT